MVAFADNLIERIQADDVAAPTTANGTPISAVGNPYTFTGRRLDTETGLMYFRNRYYSPSLGRFISRDALEYVDGWNLYRGYFAVNGMDWDGEVQVNVQRYVGLSAANAAIAKNSALGAPLGGFNWGRTATKFKVKLTYIRKSCYCCEYEITITAEAILLYIQTGDTISSGHPLMSHEMPAREDQAKEAKAHEEQHLKDFETTLNKYDGNIYKVCRTAVSRFLLGLFGCNACMTTAECQNMIPEKEEKLYKQINAEYSAITGD